jgi:Xaa-Pro dipeptidase
MERVTIQHQVSGVQFIGHADSAEPAQVTRETLLEAGFGAARLGLEKNNLFLPPRIADGIQAGLPQADWFDISGLVDELRLVKSPHELAYMRQAATVSEAMMRAAIDTAGAGVSEQEIAAEVHRAMILAGGEYPGFTPFIRSTRRLGEEHTTWSNDILRPGDTLFVELAGCVARYHAPMGRLVFVGRVPDGTDKIEKVCLAAFQRVIEAIKPGAIARQVYQAWQDCVDEAGLTHYRRHHCGYLVGIGFPPSWVGGSMVVGLRHDSPLVLQPGMTFHLLSWLMGTGQGDYFISNTALLTEDNCEVLTTVPQHLQIV